MRLYNCHTHTHNSPDSNAIPEEMTDAAMRCGLLGHAVTDHLDCELYAEELNRSIIQGTIADTEKQKALHPEVNIFLGIEIAEAFLRPSYASDIISSYEWDIVMGSIHSVQLEGFTEFFSGIDFRTFDDKLIDAYLTQYFIDLQKTASETDYDSLSHLTVPLRYIIHKYNKKVNIEKYSRQIDSILKTVIERQRSLELNTSGYSEKNGFFMPDADIIKRYIDFGGRDFTIGSDAHTPEKMDCGLREGVELLLSFGVSQLNCYEKRQKISYPVSAE